MGFRTKVSYIKSVRECELAQEQGDTPGALLMYRNYVVKFNKLLTKQSTTRKPSVGRDKSVNSTKLQNVET